MNPRKLLTVLLCTLFLLLFTITLHSQTPIAVLTFMSADNAAEYEQLEKEIWQPLHAEAIEQGKLLGWYLYRVVSPFDGKRKYNYMVVNVYPNWDAMENPFMHYNGLMKSVHKNMSAQEIGMKTDQSRKMIKSERWIRRDAAVKEGMTNKDVKYVVIDWMDVQNGHMGDYFKMESEVYKPVHQLRVDAGHILAWGLFSKMGYSELPGVDAATSASYASWSDLWGSYPEGAWEKAHPGKDPAKIGEEMMKHRVMTGSDIFKLITFVEAGMDD